MMMKPIFKGIDHIQIAAPSGSEEKAREFYGKLLGMQEIEKPESLKARGGCWFQCGTQEVHIGIQPDFVPAKKAHPGFTVNNLTLLKSQLEDAACLISEEPPIEGRARFFAHDPFGNRIEFLEYV